MIGMTIPCKANSSATAAVLGAIPGIALADVVPTVDVGEPRVTAGTPHSSLKAQPVTLGLLTKPSRTPSRWDAKSGAAIDPAEGTKFEGTNGLPLSAMRVCGLRHAAALLQMRKTEFEAKKDWFRPRTSGIPRENSVSRALADLFGLIRSEQAISGSGVQAVDLRHISIERERPRPYDPGIGDESKPTDLCLAGDAVLSWADHRSA